MWSWLAGAAAAVAMVTGVATAADRTPSFAPVQPGLFDAPGALVTAWADYDRDGDADLAVTFKSGEIRLYRNDRGMFANVAGVVGLLRTSEELRAAAWGDYDGDGDPDLYLASKGRKYLYRNDGGRFVEIGRVAGIDAPGSSARQAVWIDQDLDGDLDLFVASRSGPNILFRNEGGRFRDVAAELGLADARRSVGACWFDMDEDGDLDLFVANQDGDTDAMFRSERGRFTDVARSLGMDRAGRAQDEGGVGCAIGDFDNDGRFDLFVAAYGRSLLYRNLGSGRFAEQAVARGIDLTGHHVAAAWADYDHDGQLDLFVTGYTGSGTTAKPDDRLYRNRAGKFENMLAGDHALNAADHGAQWADFDSDGDLDIALAEAYPPNGRHPVLRNEASAAARARALSIQLVDVAGHATRAGAEVRLFDGKGRLLASRPVGAGEGYDAQSALPVHFGLASLAPVRVEVTFLTPRGRVKQQIRGIDPRSYRGRPLVVRQRGNS
ncbi:VCBS repeat-containing protein [Sphingomonas sp. MG17]|uniref:VCBS repeat-containing protein n=1 Tax=Sphingomonas tagetis TaxID=2949092 RepID=A0A9X2HJY1_9SPHN|nr:VCBS repeat-containing protein [Sphingomonas tagetis]MCP3731047.1 VCBS repeat-containing protein [Sphingomonas tagetis]